MQLPFMDQIPAQHLLGNGSNQEMGLENQINLEAPRDGASAESPHPDQHGVKWVASPVLHQSFFPVVAWLSKAERNKLLENLNCIHLMSSLGSPAHISTLLISLHPESQRH